MSKDLLPVTCLFRYENGELVPDGLVNKIRQDEFMKSLEEGDRVSCLLEITHDIDATHAQNNYFHKLCRVVSEDTGNDMETIKRIVKERCGVWKSKTELKSMADYTKQEMSIAISEIVQLGSEFGMNLYNI